jgi:hypothetical protein
MKKLILSAAGVILVMAAGGFVWLQAAPTVGATTVAPAYIIINVPTRVVFTASVPDPSLLPGGVNLLLTDASGKTIRTLGVMHDDGLNGDATAGDKVFSYAVTLNQASVGQIYYRVSAAFRGLLLRSQSSILTVHVDPFLLPPDPGDTGKQTLAGIDSDQDGVRDDVQRYIAYQFPASAIDRRALTQYAIATQQLLLQTTDSASSVANVTKQLDAMDCLYSIRPSDADVVRESLRAVILDTADRTRAYVQAVSLFGGHAAKLTPASDRAAKCTF